MFQYFFGISIFLVSVFLVLLVLVQRGRGGGLAGALGGPGGQSAFGTKAGDLFTWITIWVAIAWIVLCSLSVIVLKPRGLPTMTGGASSSSSSTDAGGSSMSPVDPSASVTEPTGNVPPSSLEAGLPAPPIDMELPGGAAPQAEIEGMPELPDVSDVPETSATDESPAAEETASENAEASEPPADDDGASTEEPTEDGQDS